MYSKLKITGEIEVVTGLHIGGGGETSMIGAVDSPVVRDPETRLPMIPGSSIKGKMRTLLSRVYNTNKVSSHNEDHDKILRLFGSSDQNNLQRARLLISDSFFNTNSEKEFRAKDISFAEIKFENTINRRTADATPRQIERVTRGAKFDLYMIYDVLNEDEVVEDFESIQKGLNLLVNDYLGGGGTRGNGRIKFNNLKIETVIGDYDHTKLKLV